MDIPLPPRPWYVKYRMYILGGAVLVALVVYALVLQLGPRTLKVEIADEQIEVVTWRYHTCPVEPEGIGGDGNRTAEL